MVFGLVVAMSWGQTYSQEKMMASHAFLEQGISFILNSNTTISKNKTMFFASNNYESDTNNYAHPVIYVASINDSSKALQEFLYFYNSKKEWQACTFKAYKPHTKGRKVIKNKNRKSYKEFKAALLAYQCPNDTLPLEFAKQNESIHLGKSYFYLAMSAGGEETCQEVFSELLAAPKSINAEIYFWGFHVFMHSDYEQVLKENLK